MKRPTPTNLILFTLWPILAPLILAIMAVILIVAWPVALFVNTKPNNSTKGAKDNTHD